MRNDDATLKNNVSSEYNYSNRDGRRSNREWIFDQAAIREMERTRIQRFKIISSYSLWKFSQWEKREYNEQRLKSFNVVHSFLNNRQERKKKDTVEFQAENNKLIIGSRGIDRISRWAEFPWTGQKHRGEADGGFFTGGRETNDVLNFVGREERRRKNRGGSRKTG